MARPDGSARRAVQGMTLGVIKATRAREERNQQMGYAEVDLQYQVPISGTANTGIAFTTITLSFEIDFFYAPGQRNNDLERPHLTVGGESDVPIGLTAVVTAWEEDPDNGAIRGATVAIGVIAATSTPFTGTAHLNFQGYGAQTEDDTDLISAAE